MIKSQSDQELVELLARGDHRAFETVYARCRVPVFRFLLHMTGSREIADEVAQDAFLFLLRKPQAFDGNRGSLTGFLLGVARNLVRHTLRSAPDEVPIEAETLRENDMALDEPLESPLEAAIRQQSAAALQAALLQVPQPFREAIVLCDLEEMSYAEAAGALGIPIGTVRSRLYRGHIALVDILSRQRCAQQPGVKR